MVDFEKMRSIRRNVGYGYRVDPQDRVGNVCMHCQHVDPNYRHCQRFGHYIDAQFGTCNFYARRGVVPNETV